MSRSGGALTSVAESGLEQSKTAYRLAPMPSAESGVSVSETSYGFAKRLDFIRDVIARRSASLPNRVRVLDVGCGTGNLVAYPLALEGHEVLAIDTHGPSIEYARKRFGALRNLTFKTLRVEECKAASFDVVICSEVLEHVDPVEPFFAAVRRTMAPGGVLVATVPNGLGLFEMQNWVWRHVFEDRWLHRQLHRWHHRRERDMSAHAFLTDASPHVNFFRVQDIARLARTEGLRIHRYRGRTFACGLVADRFFFIPGLTRLNTWLGDVLPAGAVSGWMFELCEI
ncbi:MAG: protein of unknown function, putative Methyltransferase [Gemmatimonadales bacterium]|nr:protein of unknown function, putative Methyltransferase [Gemmatimonadales bacterium]